jgi:hypothetical protein
MLGSRDRRDIGERGLAEPDMGERVRQCEHLRRLGIGAVDEH